MEDSDSSATMDDDGGLQIKCEADLESAERSPRAGRQNGDASASTSVNGAAAYDARKDDRYWERRRKNNEAAKRSREKRRMNDIVMEKRIVELSSENNRLRTEIERLRRLYNITDADIATALGAPASGGCNTPRTTVQPAPVTPNTDRRRSLNRNGKDEQQRITSSTSSSSLRKPAFSDASSLDSSNENEAAEQRLNGSAVVRRRAHARTQSTDAFATCKPPIVTHPTALDANTKEPTSLGLRINAGANEQELLADAGEYDLAAENGGATRTLPDLVAVLNMLQNIPLLQALVKGTQPQPAASSQLSIFQQFAILQQLAGLSGSLLLNSPIGSCQLTSPPLSATSNSAPTASHLLAAAKRNTAVLDLSRKPNAFDTPRPSCEHECDEENEHMPAEDSQVYEENRTLRVELDQINAQVRELKEILLQRDTQVIASSGANAKRQSNANAMTAACTDAAESHENEQDASYSKRTKLAIVDDVNCN